MFRTYPLTALLAGCILTASFLVSPIAAAQTESQPSVAAVTAANVPVSGTWRGRVETLVIDNLQAGTSRTRLFLHTPQQTLELQSSGDTVLRSGQMAEVTGLVSGSRVTVAQVTTPQTAAGTGTCSTVGAQDVAIILVSFPSEALLSSVTPELMSSGFFGAGQTVDTFLRESSFGQTWITGEVFGPYVLDGDYFDQPLAARDAALRAAASYTDLTKYTGFYIVGPQDAMGMDSGGMALLGCGEITSPQGELYAASMWLGAESMVSQADVASTAAHEMGHGLGLEHSRFADYGAETLGPVGQVPAPWDELHDYGDSFSNMGRNSGQWSAPQKALLGWLQSGANYQNVTTNGSFNLSPYEQSGGVQAIHVRRSAAGNAWLWLEYRQADGDFDATLPAAAFAGALVHYEDPALTATISGVNPATYANLVNFQPSTYANDPTLHVGETWNDPYGNLSITVNSATAEGMNVSVSYAPAPACPSSAGAAQSFTAAGGTGKVPVTAPAGCSWSAAASVPWISLTSAGSGSGNGTVSFSVAANPNISPRWGKITVGGALAVVTQAGGVGSITISPQSAEIPASGGTGVISVTTSAPDVPWSYMPTVSWITDIECSCYQSTGSATLRYIVAANTGAQRTGTITVGNLAFTITQDGGGKDPGGITWTQYTPTNAPISRMNFAMAPFGNSGQAILYGGNWDTTRFTDTWLWDGSNWTLLQPANNPGILAEHAMAYDAAHGQIVLFGGMAGTPAAYSNQTWIWNGSNWQQMHPAVSPPARVGHAMAYDAVAQKVVLFGGYGTYAESNDTWTWDGSNWTQVLTLASPPKRYEHSMAFDAARGVTVLFGGWQSEGLVWLNDTWEFDGSNWQQQLPDNPPAGRAGHVLVYDPSLQAVVMVGGAGGKDVTATSWVNDFHRETWLWSGEAWVQQFPANQPGPAYTLGAAYNPASQGVTFHVGDDLTCLSRGPKTFLLTGTAVANATAAGFRLTPAATSAVLAPGASAQVALSTAVFNEFQAQLALSVSGLPTGVTASFAPASIAAPGNGASTLTLAAASGTAPGVYSLTLMAAGGNMTKTQPFSLTVTPAPSFSLTPSVVSANLVSGASAALKLTTAALNGFKAAIGLSASGLPKGVTASFAPASIAAPGSGSSTLTLTAASGTATGSFSLTVSAAGGGVTKTQTLSITVLPPPSFSLTSSASSATVMAGASATLKLTTAALYGFDAPIALSVTGVPTGVMASFAPAGIAAPGTGSSTMTLAAASGTAAGAFSLTVTAKGGGLTMTHAVSLTIVLPASFSLTPSATSVTVKRGASGTLQLTTNALNGFKAQVAFSVSGLPKGVTANFAPASIASPGGGTSTMTLAAASGAAAGSYNVTVTAAGGGVSKTQALALAVK
jgi:M6 family metalloprotease-like protein